MQTHEQKDKDTFENRRNGEGCDGEGKLNVKTQRGGETKGEGWKEGRSEKRDGESGHKGGSLLFL